MGKEIRNAEGKLVYKELGERINVTSVPAGIYTNSEWIDAIEWVRNVRVFVDADQTYDVCVFLKDSEGTITSFNAGAIVNQTATSNTYRPHIFTGAFGYSLRVSVKNVGAVTMTKCKVKIQLMD